MTNVMSDVMRSIVKQKLQSSLINEEQLRAAYKA
jgi:hypothetical protein